MNLREKDTKRLHKLNTGWASLMLDKKGDIFLLGSRIMQKMDAKSDALKSISYQAEMKMDLAAERETMLTMCTNSIKNASTMSICTGLTGML